MKLNFPQQHTPKIMQRAIKTAEILLQRDLKLRQSHPNQLTKEAWMSLDPQKRLKDEIRRTSSNLRIKRFRRVHDENKPPRQFDMTASGNYIESSQPSSQSRSFSEFMRRKKVENSYVRNKMKVFGNALTERSKAKIECEINQLLEKNQKMSEDGPVDTAGDNINKMKKYMVCHKILENLFLLMVENTQHIALKRQSPHIYNKIKEEMVSVMIDEDNMHEIENKINEELRQRERQNFNFSRAKLFDLRKRRKPFYLLKEQKKDELAEQIDKTLQRLKAMVLQALSEQNNSQFNQQIQIKWSRQYSMKSLGE